MKKYYQLTQIIYKTNLIKKIYKNNWGWSTDVDIYKPTNVDEHNIVFGGSYGLSGKIAEDYVNWFIEEMEKLGYEVKIKNFNW